MTGKIANTIGVAPRSPAQPSISRSRRSKSARSVNSTADSGRAIAAVTIAIAAPSGMMSSSSLGNTRSPSIRKRPSCATQARPSWKVTIVRRAGVDAVPSTSPARIYREEARAVQRQREAEGERPGRDRRHRIQAGRRQRHPAQEQHRGGRHREADHEADRQLLHHEQQRVLEPVGVVLDRVDAADHEQDGDRVVDARLALERARQLAPQRGGAQDGEDRGGVGRRHRRAEQQRLERLERRAAARRRPRSAPRSPACRGWRARSTSRARAGSRRSRTTGRPRTG